MRSRFPSPRPHGVRLAALVAGAALLAAGCGKGPTGGVEGDVVSRASPAAGTSG